MSLPTADDLFRPTADPDQSARPEPEQRSVRAVPDTPAPAPGADSDAEEGAGTRKRPSGRVRHDEKMTVYVTADELLEIEHARLALRSGHRLAVDRGRLVREALHLVLADFEANGADSALVRRLTEE